MDIQFLALTGAKRIPLMLVQYRYDKPAKNKSEPISYRRSP